MINVTETDEGITFTIRVIPRASRSGITGEVDGNLKVRVSAAPVDGAANEEVVRVLAKAFGVSRSSVEIIAGETSKTKRIRISGADAKRLRLLAAG